MQRPARLGVRPPVAVRPALPEARCWLDAEAEPVAASRTSPTASPRRSSASGASSSSGSTRAVELLPVELRGDEARRTRSSASAAGIVDAVAPAAVAVKPQSAFFEALGPAGAHAFAEVCDYARAAGLLVIADAKRGDIGSTARAYAAAFSSRATASRRSPTR